jgi:hypothetical protein
MTPLSQRTRLLRFRWLIWRLAAYVWLLRLFRREKELAETRAWFLTVLNDAGMLRTMPTGKKPRLH